jgi:hypothetical protein
MVTQVSGKIVWVTVNPGSQTVRIGSFHPITEGKAKFCIIGNEL